MSLATMRAIASMVPPAGTDTTMVTGLDGKVSAIAATGTRADTATTENSLRIITSIS